MTQTMPVERPTALDMPTASPAKEKSKSREHVDYIEYARAVAILVIVAGHTYAVAWTHFVSEDPQDHVTWLNIVPAIITGGTAYFVFISGFLYRQVFYGRTGYGDFMRKKALYVGLPYLILGTPLAFAEMYFGDFTVTASKEGVAYASNTFLDYMVLMTTGRMVTAYWYIPFIFLVFLASPFFDWFIRQEARIRIAVFAASVLVALWVVRPLDNLNPVHSFLYFTSFYLFGILFCENRNAIMEFATRRSTIAALAVLLVAIALCQALVLHMVDNLERTSTDGWGPVGFDMMFVQKFVGIVLMCGALARWGHHAGRLLSFIADHSFGLFFTHGIVLAVLIRLPERLSPHLGEPMLDLAIYSLFVITWSLLIVLIVKQITGRYSRYVIGC